MLREGGGGGAGPGSIASLAPARLIAWDPALEAILDERECLVEPGAIVRGRWKWIGSIKRVPLSRCGVTGGVTTS